MDRICSICQKPGVSFLEGNQIQTLNDCLIYNNILIDENSVTQICGLCVDDMNNAYCEYLNSLENSNIFVTIKESLDSDSKSDSDSPENEIFDAETGESSEMPELSFKGSDSEHLSDAESTDSLYKCELCMLSFSDLDTHYLEAHSNDTKKCSLSHACPKCDKKFANLLELRKHVDLTHLDFFFYKCNSCDFRTNYHQSLGAHARKGHSSIKKTPKVAIVKPMRRKIENSEDEERKLTKLSKRSKTKTLKKTRKCPQCPEMFAKFNLNHHMNEKHPGIYLFSCDKCSFQSNFGQTMAAHKRRDQCIEYALEEMFGSD